MKVSNTTTTVKTVVLFLVTAISLTLPKCTAAADNATAAKNEPAVSSKGIVGGEDASPGDYPYYVLSDPDCGGALISPTVVLTAAHCSKPHHKHGKGSTMYVGVNYRNTLDNGDGVKNGKKIVVAKHAIHPNYDKYRFNYDFALYLLKNPYKIESSVKLVLNQEHSKPSDGATLTAIGLGTLDTGGPLASTLQYVDVPVVPHDVCNGYYGGGIHKESMLCAGFKKGGKDSCQADSGGPIVQKSGNLHLHVGVISFGSGCAEKNSAGVYARTDAAIDWIKKVACKKWGVVDLDLCCADDKNWLYKDDIKKTCGWLKGKGKKKRNNLCKKSKVKKGCPSACNVC